MDDYALTIGWPGHLVAAAVAVDGLWWFYSLVGFHLLFGLARARQGCLWMCYGGTDIRQYG